MTDLLDYCRVEGCTRKIAHKSWGRNKVGLCDAHYQRLKRTGNVQAHIPIIEKHRGCNLNSNGLRKKCKLTDCHRPASSRGFCHMHWKRIKRNDGIPYGHVPIGELNTYKAEARAREREAKGA